MLDSVDTEWSVRFSEQECSTGVPSSDSARRALEAFTQHGFVRLENVFSREEMVNWSEYYRKRYRRLLRSTVWENRRPLYTVAVAAGLNSPRFYANPLVMSVVKPSVGDDCVVGAVSTVISFPQAPAQYLHRDSKALFDDDYEFDRLVPAYAMTMLVPLVECNPETGCTEVWPGSHRCSEASRPDLARTPPLQPTVAVGSVLLTDSRLLHRGGPNLSDQVRPLLYVSYHRHWFRDFGGYENRLPVDIHRREFRRVPSDLRHMFAWTQDPFADVSRPTKGASAKDLLRKLGRRFFR